MRLQKRELAIFLLLAAGTIVGPLVFAESRQGVQQEMSPEEIQALKAKQQQAEIRKILSSEPDPSLMLEPIPDPPEDKRKKVPPKPERPIPPAERAVAAQAAGQPVGLGASLAPGPSGVAATGGAPTAVGGGLSPNSLNPVLSLNPATGGGGRNANLRMGRLHGEAPPSPEIAVILHNKQFFPSRIRIKAGVPTKVFFTTTGERPAAIVVEQLQVQKWLAKESGGDRKLASTSEYDRAKFEVTREVVNNKMTEITFEPRRGTYSFHDAISGAKGQIVCE